MKYLFITATLFFFSLNFLMSQARGDITVIMPELESVKRGKIIILIFESKEGFPFDIDKANQYSISTGYVKGTIFTFGKIPYGEYAVVVYHDKNSNEKLDTNFRGIPVEPIGTSSKKKSKRPKFSKSNFILNKPTKEIKIILH